MGQSPPGNSYNKNGKGMPLLNGPTDFGKQYPIPTQWTTKVTKISEKDDLLICVRGNTTGRMNWSERRYCIGRGLATIRPKFHQIDRRILFFFLKMKTRELLSNTTGSTFPNLTKDKLNKFPFPLIPLDGQINSGEELERQFTIIDNIEKIVTQNRIYSMKFKENILKITFKGNLVP